MAAAMKIGEAWNGIFQEVSEWKEVEEFPYFEGEDEALRAEFPEDAEHNKQFHYCSVYIGYSISPQARFTVHKQNMSIFSPVICPY